jgi:hypothetical protein
VRNTVTHLEMQETVLHLSVLLEERLLGIFRLSRLILRLFVSTSATDRTFCFAAKAHLSLPLKVEYRKGADITDSIHMYRKLAKEIDNSR